MRFVVVAVVLLLSCGDSAPKTRGAFDQVQCGNSPRYRVTELQDCGIYADRVVTCCEGAPSFGVTTQACAMDSAANLATTCQTSTMTKVAQYCLEQLAAFRCDYVHHDTPDAGGIATHPNPAEGAMCMGYKLSDVQECKDAGTEVLECCLRQPTLTREQVDTCASGLVSSLGLSCQTASMDIMKMACTMFTASYVCPYM